MPAPRVRKKLIEVALPLDAINKASAREKSIRHGHPSTLHLWWARRPLAAARAVIFAQMVDDLRLLQTGNIAPVDLAQAAIGSCMAVYTRYQPVANAPLHSNGDASRVDCVAPRSHMPHMLRRRALPRGRLPVLGATRGFTTDCYGRLCCGGR